MLDRRANGAMSLRKSSGRSFQEIERVLDLLSQMGVVAYYEGRYEKAEQYLSEALELSRTLEDRYSIATALDGLGLVKTAQGQFDDAQALFQESTSLFKEIGEHGSLAQALTHMGSALLKEGDQEVVRKYFVDALSIAREMQTLPVLLDALVGEAEIQTRQGAVESALEILTAVSQNPSSSLATKTRAEQLRLDLLSQMPTQRVKTLKAKVNHKTIDSLIIDILKDVNASLLIFLAVCATS